MQVSPHVRRGHERTFSAAAGAGAVIKAQVTATHLGLLNGRFKLVAGARIWQANVGGAPQAALGDPLRISPAGPPWMTGLRRST